MTDRTSKLLSLFDAIYTAPADASASANLHDHTGDIIRTLRLWAADHNIKLNRNVLCGYDRAWDTWELTAQSGSGRLTVHDSQSERSLASRATRTRRSWTLMRCGAWRRR
jgi:hypothetical protein